MMARAARRTPRAPPPLARFRTLQEGRDRTKKGVIMRCGKLRGVMLAMAFGAFLTFVGESQAGGFGHRLPREVPAYDFNTGGEFYAPPVPYGHYAKDYGACVHKAIGCVKCSTLGRLCGLCGGLGHNKCGHCGGGGCGHC